MRIFPPRLPHTSFLLSVFGLVAVLALSGCGTSPEDAYADYVEAARTGAWEELYGMLDEESRAALDTQLLALAEAGSGMDGAAARPNLDGADLFARLVDEHPALHRQFDVAGYTLLETEARGDEARLTVELNRGGLELEPAVVRLRREDGIWKIHLP